MAAPKRKFTPRVLQHPKLGTLPSSIPLVIPDDTEYDFASNELRLIEGKSRSKLKIVPQTLELIKSIKKTLSVLSICGPCRTGKSYVLSRMLGSSDAFDLGHTMDPKTFGIWIGTTVLECDEFTLLLMDTEGIDAATARMKDDASVLVMTILLSSFMIYNSLQVPKKNDLEKMSCFVKLSSSIAVQSTAQDEEEDELVELRNHFPDFLWLLRDVHLMPVDDSGKEIPPTEYLKTKILVRSKKLHPTKSDEVSLAILSFFPTVECRILPSPHSNPLVMRDIAKNEQVLEKRFNEEVNKLIEYLFQKVQPKRGYIKGMHVDGPLFADLATKYIEALSDPDSIPCLDNTWQSVVRQRCNTVIDELVAEYDAEMGSKVAEVGLPLEEESFSIDDNQAVTLFGLHRTIELQKTEALLKQVGHFLGDPTAADQDTVLSKESLVAEFGHKLAVFEEGEEVYKIQGKEARKKKVTGGALEKYTRQNYAESHTFCTKLFSDLYQPVEQRALDSDASYTFEKLLKDLDNIQTQYLGKAVGPAKWEVYRERSEHVKSQQAMFKKVRGFKNEAFKAAQEASEKSAKAAELSNTVQDLQAQMKDEAELNTKKLEKLQEQHQQEMERCRQQDLQRMEEERRKCDDFMKAQMSEMAEMARLNREQLQQQNMAFMNAMQQSMDRSERTMELLAGMVTAMHKPPPPPSPPDDGGCFAAGTKITLTNGKEMPIEKQAAGLKLLAQGGETTTITEEYVDNDLLPGQQLFGINDDDPFASLNHPFWTTEGWKCLNPEGAKEENPNIDFKLLQVGDIVFRIAQTNPLLYEPVKVHKFTFMTVTEPSKIYGLHLDGPHSYHANGYVVAANYPVLTKKRVRDGMKKLNDDEKQSLKTGLTSVQSELTKVLGTWAKNAFKDMELVHQDEINDECD